MASGKVRSRARGKAGFNVAFLTNRDIEYTIKGIYDKFEEDLPKYFMVTTGSDSAALDCRVRPGQVIRFHCTARKERVAGRCETQDGQPQLVSLHTEADMSDFQVLQKDKTAVPYSRCRIHETFKERLFPITIQITRKLEERCRVGQFQLTHIFPEMHLLGNLIENDKFQEDVVYFPVFLGDLRLVEITGIRDQPSWEWQAYQIDHQRDSCSVEYDTHYSSLRVAIYKPPAIDKSVPVSGYTEAVRYIPMSEFLNDIVCHDSITLSLHKTPTATGDKKTTNNESKKAHQTMDGDDPVRKIAHTLRKASLDSSVTKHGTTNQANSTKTRPENLSESKSMATHPSNDENALMRLLAKRKLSLDLSDSKTTDDILRRRDPKGNTVGQLYCKLDISVQSANRDSDVYEEIEVSSMDRLPDCDSGKDCTRGTSPKLLQKSQNITEARERRVPALPKRPTEKAEYMKANDNSTKYTNMIPRGEAIPVTKQPFPGAPVAHPTELKEENALYVDMQKLPTIEASNDVEKLTLDELGEFLKVLKLGHAVDKFKDRMVDGAILVELDKDILESEFGLNKLEAIRLLKFAKTGHVPV